MPRRTHAFASMRGSRKLKLKDSLTDCPRKSACVKTWPLLRRNRGLYRSSCSACFGKTANVGGLRAAQLRTCNPNRLHSGRHCRQQLSPQLLEIQAPLLGICCRCVKSIAVGYKCDKPGSNSCTPCEVNGNGSCEMVSFFRSSEARSISDHR
jgi:hypothetical protein